MEEHEVDSGREPGRGGVRVHHRLHLLRGARLAQVRRLGRGAPRCRDPKHPTSPSPVPTSSRFIDWNKKIYQVS